MVLFQTIDLNPFFKNILQSLQRSQFVISVAAFFFGTEYFYVIGSHSLPHYPIFLLSSTLAYYNIHRVYTLSNARAPYINANGENYRTKSQNSIWLAAIGCMISGAILIKQEWYLDPSFYFPIAVSIIYTFPFLSFNLRNYHLTKVIWVGVVWAWCASIIPYCMSPQGDSIFLLLFFCERLLLIIALTIPFDFRDKIFDLHHDQKNLSQKYSEDELKSYISILLLISQMCVFLLWMNNSYGVNTAIFLYIFYYYLHHILINHRWADQPSSFFTLRLDSMIILHAVIINISRSWY